MILRSWLWRHNWHLGPEKTSPKYAPPFLYIREQRQKRRLYVGCWRSLRREWDFLRWKCLNISAASLSSFFLWLTYHINPYKHKGKWKYGPSIHLKISKNATSFSWRFRFLWSDAHEFFWESLRDSNCKCCCYPFWVFVETIYIYYVSRWHNFIKKMFSVELSSIYIFYGWMNTLFSFYSERS